MTRRREGFTLRELTIALVVLGIAAGVAVPAFARLGERDAALPGDAILRLLRDARRTAIREGVGVRVVLDPASGRFRVDTVGLFGTGTLADTVLDIESGTTIEADSLRVTFVFRPNGSAIADSVVVRSPQATAIVRVDPWDGRAYVELP